MAGRLRFTRARGWFPVIAASLIALASLHGAANGYRTHADDGPWSDRLETLEPDDALTYFELAEEVADAAESESEHELARRLFGLAGVLDSERLGRSAALALADMADDTDEKRRLRALADLLGRRSVGIWWTDSLEDDLASVDTGRALTLAEAMGYYRRGEGARALNLLRRDGMDQALEVYARRLPGGPDRILEEVRTYRTGRSRPNLSDSQITMMMRLEVAMLAGEDRPWSADLAATGGRRLLEIDPQRLEAAFSVDAERPYYRNGRWVTAP